MPDRSAESRRAAEPRIALIEPEKAQRFIERYGSITDASARQVATAAVQRLLTDQKRLRMRIHTLEDSGPTGSNLSAADRDELETLRRDNEDLEARIPKTGEVVLSAADAATWDKIKKLGKTPEEITTAVTEYPKLAGEREVNENKTKAREAGKALGWNPDNTADILADKGITIAEVRTETVDGKAVQVPYIRERDAAKDSAPIKLADYAKQKLGAYTAALTAPVAAAGANGSSDIAGNRTAGVEYIAQDSGGTAPVGNPADRFIAEREKRNATRTNPLLPQNSNK